MPGLFKNGVESHLQFSPHTLENIGVCYFMHLNHQVLEKIKYLAKFSFYQPHFSK